MRRYALFLIVVGQEGRLGGLMLVKKSMDHPVAEYRGGLSLYGGSPEIDVEAEGASAWMKHALVAQLPFGFVELLVEISDETSITEAPTTDSRGESLVTIFQATVTLADWEIAKRHYDESPDSYLGEPVLVPWNELPRCLEETQFLPGVADAIRQLLPEKLTRLPRRKKPR